MLDHLFGFVGIRFRMGNARRGFNVRNKVISNDQTSALIKSAMDTLFLILETQVL